MLLAGYRAAVDLPAAASWQDLADRSPEALIVLSVRDSAAQWWESASQTVFNPARPAPPAGSPMAGFISMITDVLRARLGVTDWSDPAAMMSAYERHNDAVRALAPAARLVEWRPEDGWAPLTAALGLPMPDAPFPRLNTRAQFREPILGQRIGLAEVAGDQDD